MANTVITTRSVSVLHIAAMAEGLGIKKIITGMVEGADLECVALLGSSDGDLVMKIIVQVGVGKVSSSLPPTHPITTAKSLRREQYST